MRSASAYDCTCVKRNGGFLLKVATIDCLLDFTETEDV